MKRALAYLIGLAVLVIAVLVPAALYGWDDDGGPGEYDDTTITSYVATFDVDDRGDMDVVETLTVKFPYGDKHGIFRFFDRTFADDPNVRWVPHDIEVTRDGGDVPVDITKEQRGRYTVARIGDPDVYVDPGKHVYEISYSIDGVLIDGRDGHESTFYWNLIPPGWAQEIKRADLTVTLPGPAADVQCAIGELEDCDELSGEGTDTLHVTTAGLDPRTSVTVQAGLDSVAPAMSTLPWAPRFDSVFGTSILGLLVVLGIAVLAGLLGYVLVRRTRETNPQFPLMYAPPEGIGPAQAAYLVTEEVDDEQYVATLMYAAEKGAISLHRAEDRTWTITDKNGAQGWAGLDPVTNGVAHLLGGPGTSFVADPDSVPAGLRLKDEISSFKEGTKTWASSSGLMTRSGLGGLGGFVVGGLILIVIYGVISNPFGMSALLLVPGLFVVFGAAIALPGAATRRTRAGRDLWSRAGGFRRILATPSAEQRFDFSGRQELYTAYIPWAVAFGCADEWAGKYRTEMGAEPPVPTYFPHYYTGAAVGSAVSSMVGDFNSTLSSAISSYEATQKSSSSGSGGGGFSGGGGGGGGGGGSW